MTGTLKFFGSLEDSDSDQTLTITLEVAKASLLDHPGDPRRAIAEALAKGIGTMMERVTHELHIMGPVSPVEKNHEQE